MKIIIGIGIVVVAGVATAYFLYKRNRKRHVKIDLPIDEVHELSLADVVGFFKSLQLNKDKDEPFIATSDKIKELVNVPEDMQGKQLVLLGVYDSKTDTFDPLKLMAVEHLSQEIVNLMGNDPLVKLS